MLNNWRLRAKHKAKPRLPEHINKRTYLAGKFGHYMGKRATLLAPSGPYQNRSGLLQDRALLYELKMRKKLAANVRAVRKSPIRLRLPSSGLGAIAGSQHLPNLSSKGGDVGQLP